MNEARGQRGGPLDKTEAAQLQRLLFERLQKHVGLEVWTRTAPAIALPGRDDSRHASEVLALVRQIASLHPAITVTPYDADRFADRAASARIDLLPATVVRASSRAVQCVGLFSGVLFSAFIDLLTFASAGASPLQPETRAALRALERPLEVEALVAPYDPYSAHMVGLLSAFAVEAKQIRLRIVEAAEFPTLAAQRMLTEVPLVLIEGRRFVGAWEEADLLEQVRRVAAGNEEPVIRPRVYATEYVDEDEAKRLVLERRASLEGALPPASGSGLVLPGQDR